MVRFFPLLSQRSERYAVCARRRLCGYLVQFHFPRIVISPYTDYDFWEVEWLDGKKPGTIFTSRKQALNFLLGSWSRHRGQDVNVDEQDPGTR